MYTYCRYMYTVYLLPNIGGPVWPVGSHYYEVILSQSQLLTYIIQSVDKTCQQILVCTKSHNKNDEIIGNEQYSIEVRVPVCQGCPDCGSGAKFGSLAKFIWLLCVLFCVMHFGSGGLRISTLLVFQKVSQQFCATSYVLVSKRTMTMYYDQHVSLHVCRCIMKLLPNMPFTFKML